MCAIPQLVSAPLNVSPANEANEKCEIVWKIFRQFNVKRSFNVLVCSQTKLELFLRGKFWSKPLTVNLRSKYIYVCCVSLNCDMSRQIRWDKWWNNRKMVISAQLLIMQVMSFVCFCFHRHWQALKNYQNQIRPSQQISRDTNNMRWVRVIKRSLWETYCRFDRGKKFIYWVKNIYIWCPHHL